MVKRTNRVFTIKTALEEFFENSIGESTLRDAVRKGQIPHARIGKRIILREESLNAWLDRAEKASYKPPLESTVRYLRGL